MSIDANTRTHDLIRRTINHVLLVVAGAIAVTWSWNTTVPELSGLAEFRFAEGLSIAVLAYLLGALFESGRQLVARHADHRANR